VRLPATHRDLEALVREGRFREDLYYRINVVTIMLPPLRERREDLPPLIEHFLRAFAGKNGKSVRGLTREARDTLLRYDYPGNIRELENLIERAVVLTRDDVIGVEDLPWRSTRRRDQEKKPGSSPRSRGSSGA
jgi:DNA-binding NtrC family response regulator